MPLSENLRKIIKWATKRHAHAKPAEPQQAPQPSMKMKQTSDGGAVTLEQVKEIARRHAGRPWPELEKLRKEEHERMTTRKTLVREPCEDGSALLLDSNGDPMGIVEPLAPY